MGYSDAVAAGLLENGGRDFAYIPLFFRLTGLTLVDMVPMPWRCGNDPHDAVCAVNERGGVVLVYARAGSPDLTPVVLRGPATSTWTLQCYNTRTGHLGEPQPFDAASTHASCKPVVPGVADRVMVFRRSDSG